MYTGLIYNDMFANALPIFQSQWEFEPGEGNNTYNGYSTGGVYALGVDYVGFLPAPLFFLLLSPVS